MAFASGEGHINRPVGFRNLIKPLLFLGLAAAVAAASVVFSRYARRSDFLQTTASGVPEVPPGFAARLFASEPLVGNPSALTFDRRGRLYVGMGPQYRNPTPETPGDRVVILLDRDGDGAAETTKDFAVGLNSIQGLAWHGRDLWIANAPDLTIARDLDGDDEADEYVRIYTDLGNLEHGLHGLIWGPDGKLYMTKGNSKGLTQPGHIAPKPFRDLWGVTAPEGAPDFPKPEVFRKGEYHHAYHDPHDDWGRDGGFLRCDNLGENLEIISRGLRNPFDLVFDHSFDWLGTDNDQHEGDRVVMPFDGAHFGWGHGWSPSWTGERNPPTVPISGPVFDGSGTGVVFYDAPQFPAEWRGVWFMNDYERKRTYAYRPRWDGALRQPEGGASTDFIKPGRALFRPTDMEVGPDGALWVLSWGRLFNRPEKLMRDLLGKTGEREGRVYRIFWKDAPLIRWQVARRERPVQEWSVAELLEDLGSHLPVWRVEAQEELIRRGRGVEAELRAALEATPLPPALETWTLWTLGRLGAPLSYDPAASLNRRLQTLRILGHRRELGPEAVALAAQDPEPRVRQAAALAIRRHGDVKNIDLLKDLLARESDRIVRYSAGVAWRDLAGVEGLRAGLGDERGPVRAAAVVGLADLGALTPDEASSLLGDPATTEVAALWLARRSANPLITFEPQPGEFDGEIAVFVTPGMKPSTIRYTLDGSTPTAQSPAFPESQSIPVKTTTTIKAALFINDTQVGSPAEAVFTRRTHAGPRLVLQPPAQPTTAEAALALVKRARPERGRAVFAAAGCVACHHAGGSGRLYGPDLSAIGERADAERLIRSILEPNAEITEGYALLQVTLRDGTTRTGILREETDRHLSLAQPDGRALQLDKDAIVERTSMHTSPMPPFGALLNPADLADLTAWLLSLRK